MSRYVCQSCPISILIHPLCMLPLRCTRSSVHYHLHSDSSNENVVCSRCMGGGEYKRRQMNELTACTGSGAVQYNVLVDREHAGQTTCV
ncbi:uncharacterized protein B0H18DRAFT_1054430 [Fomitopsis serialis]|uniref:uncharacterized protein n=1 Tax=Fomitopsis serialis TaxID=139415 RepID=UPI002008BE66|nr:uncharacterized protein B0H18DRAFT_1054430 [Neoantrodia serialis]KAH9912365.1 hypothetical protein B0H18DRAFT_1054430 [Neoantrodia serialis]